MLSMKRLSRTVTGGLLTISSRVPEVEIGLEIFTSQGAPHLRSRLSSWVQTTWLMGVGMSRVEDGVISPGPQKYITAAPVPVHLGNNGNSPTTLNTK